MSKHEDLKRINDLRVSAEFISSFLAENKHFLCSETEVLTNTAREVACGVTYSLARQLNDYLIRNEWGK